MIRFEFGPQIWRWMFALPAAAPVQDIGKLADLRAVGSFLEAWSKYAVDIPILGDVGSQARESHLRLRAKAALPLMSNVGAGARDVDEIVATAKHLARPQQLGAARVFGVPTASPLPLHLVPPDTVCAVCGSDALTLEPSSKPKGSGQQAKPTLYVRCMDGSRPGYSYKKVCEACGAVHRYNEIIIPRGKRLRSEAAAPETSANVDSAVPAKRRCFRETVLDQRYFCATSQTVFEKEYLDWTTGLMESTQVSFDGMTRASRAVHREEGSIDRVYRKSLGTAWFAREALAACQEAKLPWPAPDELGVGVGAGHARSSKEQREVRQKATLRRLHPQLRQHFRRTNLLGHSRRCTRPGRCRTAAVDGIHSLMTAKCRTEVRHYKWIGRWGQRALGCVNPPGPRSAYCDECLSMGGLRTPQPDDPEFKEAAKEAAAATAQALTAAASAGGPGPVQDQTDSAGGLFSAFPSTDAPDVADAALAPPSTAGGPAPGPAPAPAPGPAPRGGKRPLDGIADQSTRTVRATTAAQRDAFQARFSGTAPVAPPRQAAVGRRLPVDDGNEVWRA